MQAMPILTLQSATQLVDALEDYLDKSEASYALVIDRGGFNLDQLTFGNGAMPPPVVIVPPMQRMR